MEAPYPRGRGNFGVVCPIEKAWGAFAVVYAKTLNRSRCCLGADLVGLRNHVRWSPGPPYGKGQFMGMLWMDFNNQRMV